MALPTLTTPLPPSPCPSLQSWLSSEVSPKPSSTALACPGQPHVWPRLGVGHWGIQAENFWEQLRTYAPRTSSWSDWWTDAVGLLGENALNSGCKAPQELKFRPGTSWETLWFWLSRRGYWSQIQEDVLELRLWCLLGGVNVLIL